MLAVFNSLTKCGIVLVVRYNKHKGENHYEEAFTD